MTEAANWTVTAIVERDSRSLPDGTHPETRHNPTDAPVISAAAMKIVRKYAGGTNLHLGGHDLGTVHIELRDADDATWLAVRDVVRLREWARSWTHSIDSGYIELGPP